MATEKTTKKTTVVKAVKSTSKAASAKKANVVKTIEDLRAELVVKLQDQSASKRGHKLGELANPHILTITRKEIARLHTAIRAAEIAKLKESK